MKLLHIDSSILGNNSVSRAISAAVVARLQGVHDSLDVQYRDVVASPLTHLSGAYLAGQSPDVQHDQALQEDLTLGGAVLAEFLAADIVVVGAPMYNFTIPSQLKSWVDRVLVAGKTFHYTATGPEGLAGGKRVILALSRGGFYGPGTPAAAAEHQESYLRAVFGFIGLPNPEVIVAEGVATGAEQRTKALDAALQQASALGA
jgi:FMN-dependent NADH-azoreductase